ncbi:MAG TPA: S8 family serine peptidase [Reyranella sp.]|jgi:hypothetical protein|nr:S8 family serine peptidase [Reyranella sp.]
MPGYDPLESAPQVDIADQIIVGFNRELDSVGMDAALKLLEALPATILTKFTAGSPADDTFFAFAIIRYDGEKSLPELQEQLAANKHIAWVERNAPVTPALFNDPLVGQQWALATLGATDPWTVTPPAGNTIVAIVDSGLRRLDGTVHVDLGNVAPAAVCQPVGFFANCVDMDGHGTLLAGTIAARPGNNIGISSAIPFNWNIGLLPVQFFSPDVPPNAAFAAIGILQAAQNLANPLFRARVINASWHVGPADGGIATLRAALQVAVNVYGCVVVFAAGNDGTDNEHFPIYPANFGSEAAFARKVLTVLATDRYDAKAFFSNYGRNFVDLGAPGQAILSTGPYLSNPPRYAFYSGTSPAAAFASAGAALVLALNPGWTHQDVVQHLKASADTIEVLRRACFGGKRLNLARAVYGPLHITAPLEGATVSLSATTFITWTSDYNNPGLTAVKIEFSTDNFATLPKTLAPAWSISAGAFPCPPGMLALTTTGRIRITPTQGNFPVVSGQFTVVP